MTDDRPTPKQGGFWRRAVAFTIDTVIISVAIAAIGITLSLLTDGRIRAGGGLISRVECSKLDRAYPEISLPEGFRPTSAARCVRSFLGHGYDWFLFVQRRVESGSVSYVTNLSYPLDPSGAAAHPFYLDYWLLVLLVAAIFVQEWKEGETLGKHALGLRVQSLGAGAPNGRQMAMRLLRFAYVIPMEAAYLADTITAMIVLLALGGLLMIATVIEFVLALRRGRLPFYDRIANTEVVRTR